MHTYMLMTFELADHFRSGDIPQKHGFVASAGSKLGIVMRARFVLMAANAHARSK